EYVVAASNLGRDEMEVIKAFGIYNADTATPIPGSNPIRYVIHPRLQSSVDSTFATETRKYILPSNPNIVVFESIVYLHGTPTTDPKFAKPIVSYQTQMTVGGI
ncbi:MAG: hypothetical protein QME64_11875, partial [bacterium]|nr:hypothetical protein [bacterium]